MTLKGPDGSKVCRLCDRPWVIHTKQDILDCGAVISVLNTFISIDITTESDGNDQL